MAARAARGSASSPFAALVGLLSPHLVSVARGLLADGLPDDDNDNGGGGGGGGNDECAEGTAAARGAAAEAERGPALRAVVFDVGGVLSASPLPAMAAWEVHRL